MPDLASVTAADLKARYSVFANTPSLFVEAVLDEARGSVTDAWIEADRVPALLALAAHLLFTELFGSNVQDVASVGQVGVTGALEEIAVGDVRVRYARQSEAASAAAGSVAGTLNGTPYGKRYIELRRRSFPQVIVA